MDLAGGRVVHGRSGRRAEYRPLRSRMAGGMGGDLSDPLDLLAVYRRSLHPSSIYVADLDRLGGRGDHDALVARLARAAPEVRFLWDGGIATTTDLIRSPALPNHLPVVGTETLASPEELISLAAARPGGPPAFSLDLDETGVVARSPGVAGRSEQDLLRAAAAAGVRTVIVLFLRRVGCGGGVPADRLERLVRAARGHELLVGGGIASITDLRLLREIGASGAIVATAIHEGRITAAELEAESFLG